ncbi:MAG TPA: class I SAM-dependent methyltransferase [Bryobacteraceae bacterium]|jgi:ubiquinone/menaquinone biosynthesis C-methylase UbiE|nr:class I SAM-dependent methyltransferase [Bryobacteraceae bacterium]
MTNVSGTPETQRFYEETGWTVQDGASVDHNLFGATEDGPIRMELHRVHNDRVRKILSGAGSPLNMLECGCGGNPERSFLDLCSRYVGVDFSERGVKVAQSAFADVTIPHEFKSADICSLPFRSGEFDAVYSAHVIYHIANAAAQKAALGEFVRVVRPGGVVVLIAANPHPLVFPVRLLRRVAADTPLLGPLLDRIRPRPLLPYKPMSITWMKRQLARGGAVDVVSAGIPSIGFYRNVTEFDGVGRLLWNAVRALDIHYPQLSAYLGNYVLLSCRKA